MHKEFLGKCLSNPVFDVLFCVFKVKTEIAKEGKFILNVFFKFLTFILPLVQGGVVLVCFGLVSLTPDFQVCNSHCLKKNVSASHSISLFTDPLTCEKFILSHTDSSWPTEHVFIFLSLFHI